MAFGISFVDIELLIRLAQNQLAESERILSEPDAGILPEAIIPVLSETSSTADSFLTKNSETNIVAAVTENIPPVALAAHADAEKSTKNQSEENDKVADIVFGLTSETRAAGIRQSPPNLAPTVTNNFSGAQSLKQNQLDAEILFRSLLEKFRMSVVYDYEVRDAVQLEEDAERKHKPLENPSRRFTVPGESSAETNRKKAIRDKENLKQEALSKPAVDAANQSSDDRIRENKKRELLEKIRAANKFL